jgi:mannitol-1-/sugar-/sorbitol-6-phosphatase
MTTSPFPGRSFDAFLFDMDGTILTSIAAAERVWTQWAVRHGVDVASFLPTIHGKRAVDTISGLQLPGVDAEAEARALTLAEIEDVEGIQAIAGAAAFLASLPSERWAVVTSAPRTLALRRIEAAGLPVPPVLITADDVIRGKPAPDGFQLAATRLGAQASNCLVFEDAIAGIQAAEAAGAAVVVVDASHLPSPQTSHPRIAGYEQLVVAVVAEGLRCMLTALPGTAPSKQGR